MESYRYGPGVFKIDWALSAPIPWKAGECARAGTVHVGGSGSRKSLSPSARQAAGHAAAQRPFVLVTQPSLFWTRAARPEGRHTGVRLVCHVPRASTVDMTEPIESQVERFATRASARVFWRGIRFLPPAELERRNANLVGGDITGGAAGSETVHPPAYAPVLSDAARWSVSVLIIHAARRSGTWHVWLSRRSDGAPGAGARALKSAQVEQSPACKVFVYKGSVS